MAGKLYKRRNDNDSKGFVFYETLRKCKLWVSAILFFGLVSFVKHPFYMSVTELEYNPVSKEIEISSKIFTDDLEEALRLTFGEKVDLLNSTQKEKNDRLVAAYFQKHFSLIIDGKKQTIEFVGAEIQEEALWSFFLVKKVPMFKEAIVSTDLLYHYRQEQINILHFRIQEQRQSYRLTHPDHTHLFKW